VRAGDVLFDEGDRGFSFYVVISGAVEILERSSGEPHVIVVHEPQQFTGDIAMLTGRSAIVTGRVAADGEVLELDAPALRKAVDDWPELGEIIIKAFLTRRSLLVSEGFIGLKIIGSRFSADAHSLRDFATRNQIPFKWIDVRAILRPSSSFGSSGFPRRIRPS
jgi:thioredoxin reductase (NADPH)